MTCSFRESFLREYCIRRRCRKPSRGRARRIIRWGRRSSDVRKVYCIDPSNRRKISTSHTRLLPLTINCSWRVKKVPNTYWCMSDTKRADSIPSGKHNALASWSAIGKVFHLSKDAVNSSYSHLTSGSSMYKSSDHQEWVLIKTQRINATNHKNDRFI